MSVPLVHSAPASTNHKDYASINDNEINEIEHAKTSTLGTTDTDSKSDDNSQEDENKRKLPLFYLFNILATLQQLVSLPELSDPTSNDLAQKPMGITHPPISAPTRRRKSISELYPCITPPPTPSLQSPALSHARSSNNFLSPENESLVFGCKEDKLVVKHQLITVCIHGDETCGLVAINELIEEGFFSTTFAQEEYKR